MRLVSGRGTYPKAAWTVQAARNYHAMLAARALARLAGVLPDSLATPACAPAQEALGRLLTPALAARLALPDPRPLLALLNSSVMNPQASTCTRFLHRPCSQQFWSRSFPR